MQKNVLDFAAACNEVTEFPTVEDWERIGYLAECIVGDADFLGMAEEAQQWANIAAWAYAKVDHLVKLSGKLA